jgi:hypothetical protein
MCLQLALKLLQKETEIIWLWFSNFVGNVTQFSSEMRVKDTNGQQFRSNLVNSLQISVLDSG